MKCSWRLALFLNCTYQNMNGCDRMLTIQKWLRLNEEYLRTISVKMLELIIIIAPYLFYLTLIDRPLCLQPTLTLKKWVMERIIFYKSTDGFFKIFCDYYFTYGWKIVQRIVQLAAASLCLLSLLVTFWKCNHLYSLIYNEFSQDFRCTKVVTHQLNLCHPIFCPKQLCFHCTRILLMYCRRQ